MFIQFIISSSRPGCMDYFRRHSTSVTWLCSASVLVSCVVHLDILERRFLFIKSTPTSRSIRLYYSFYYYLFDVGAHVGKALKDSPCAISPYLFRKTKIRINVGCAVFAALTHTHTFLLHSLVTLFWGHDKLYKKRKKMR